MQCLGLIYRHITIFEGPPRVMVSIFLAIHAVPMRMDIKQHFVTLLLYKPFLVDELSTAKLNGDKKAAAQRPICSNDRS